MLLLGFPILIRVLHFFVGMPDLSVTSRPRTGCSALASEESLKVEGYISRFHKTGEVMAGHFASIPHSHPTSPVSCPIAWSQRKLETTCILIIPIPLVVILITIRVLYYL